MSDFTQRRLNQEIKKMTENDLISAIQQGFEEGRVCTDENEWKLIRDTILKIGEELERRGVK